MHKFSKIIILIGISLILISVILFLDNAHEEVVAGEKSADVLHTIKENTFRDVQTINNKSINEDIVQTVNVEGYDYIGTIIIPVLNLELPIMSEYDYDRLKIAPCRYYGSIHTNDLIICAHSYKTHFKYLNKLKQKDLVIITDINGNNYIYEVVTIEVLKPNQVSEMINNDYDLTLYTCTNDGQNRITVRCNKVLDLA